MGPRTRSRCSQRRSWLNRESNSSVLTYRGYLRCRRAAYTSFRESLIVPAWYERDNTHYPIPRTEHAMSSGALISLALFTFLIVLAIAVYQLISVRRAQRTGERAVPHSSQSSYTRDDGAPALLTPSDRSAR